MSKIYFIKEDMTNTHMTKCSLSLVIREIKLKSQQNTATRLLTTNMKTMALLSIGEDGTDWESQCCGGVSQNALFHFAFPHQDLHTTSLQLWSCHPPDWKQPDVDVSTWGNITWQWEGTDCWPWNARKTFKALCKVKKSQTRKAVYRVIPFIWDSGNDKTTEIADQRLLGAGGGKRH